jgi:hypothetical protein
MVNIPPERFNRSISKIIFRFDDGNFLYSRELLLNKAKTYEITIKNQLYQLAIKDMSDRVTVEDMWQFVRSKTPCKRPQDLIRMLETLLKQTIRSRMVCIRNQFFEKNQILYDDGLHLKSFLTIIFLSFFFEYRPISK